MVRRARHYVLNPFDAEDVVSDCWLSLIRHAEQLQTMVSAARSTYIMRCVSSKSIDYLRKKQRSGEVLHEQQQQSLSLQEAAAWADTEEILLIRSNIMDLLYLLPLKERQVITLRLKEWTTNEIAHELNLSESSVRVYAARATSRLRSIFRCVENIGKGKNTK